MNILDDLFADLPLFRRTLRITGPAFGIFAIVLPVVLWRGEFEAKGMAQLSLAAGMVATLFFAASVLWGEESEGTLELLTVTPMGMGSILGQIAGAVALPSCAAFGVLFALFSIPGKAGVPAIAVKALCLMMGCSLLGATLGLSCGGRWMACTFWRFLRFAILMSTFVGWSVVATKSLAVAVPGILAIGALSFFLLHFIWRISSQDASGASESVGLRGRMQKWSGPTPEWASPIFWRDLHSGKAMAILIGLLCGLGFLSRNYREYSEYLLVLALAGGVWLAYHTAGSAFGERIDGLWEELSLTSLSRSSVVKSRLASTGVLGAILLLPALLLAPRPVGNQPEPYLVIAGIFIWWLSGSLWGQVLGTWMTSLAAAVFVSLFCAAVGPILILAASAMIWLLTLLVLSLEVPPVTPWPFGAAVTLTLACAAGLPGLVWFAARAMPLELHLSQECSSDRGHGRRTA